MALAVAKIPCICLTCGKNFEVNPSRIKQGRGKHCSLKCSSMARHNQVERICQQCGEIFYEIPSRVLGGKGKFRSTKCVSKSQRIPLVDRICLTCGKPFQSRNNRVQKGEANYCSQACRGIATSGANHHTWRGGHKDYRGANWKVQRKLVRERDGNICQSCHRKPHKGEKSFHIHHIKPFRYFNGDYITANDLGNLITLCPTCHKKAEFGNIPIPRPLL